MNVATLQITRNVQYRQIFASGGRNGLEMATLQVILNAAASLIEIMIMATLEASYYREWQRCKRPFIGNLTE